MPLGAEPAVEVTSRASTNEPASASSSGGAKMILRGTETPYLKPQPREETRGKRQVSAALARMSTACRSAQMTRQRTWESRPLSLDVITDGVTFLQRRAVSGQCGHGSSHDCDSVASARLADSRSAAVSAVRSVHLLSGPQRKVLQTRRWRYPIDPPGFLSRRLMDVGQRGRSTSCLPGRRCSRHAWGHDRASSEPARADLASRQLPRVDSARTPRLVHVTPVESGWLRFAQFGITVGSTA